MIYRRKGKLFIHAQSKLSVGAWIATPPFVSLDAESPAESKGRAIREALAASVEGVAVPGSFNDLFKPIYELSGTRTWSDFGKSAISCDVSRNGEVIEVRPSLNRGPDYGFEPKREGTVRLRSPSDEELGRALDDALAASE
jgi:hypothetical protein